MLRHRSLRVQRHRDHHEDHRLDHPLDHLLDHPLDHLLDHPEEHHHAHLLGTLRQPVDPKAAAAAVEKLLKRGRLNFKLLEARGLKKKGSTDKKFSADPYVKLRIGSHPLTAKETKSKTLKKCTSTVIFHEETLAFDLTDPKALVADGDVPLRLEVYDENLLSDELLGEVRFSALRFFDGKVHRETLPLRLPALGPDGLACGELEVEIKMDIALVGMLSLVLMEGRNLKSMELIGKQDPYCKLSIGGFSKRGKTIPKGGRNPYFGEEELLFWVTEDLWVNRMQLSLFDEDIGSDDLIGSAQFSVLHFMETLGPQEHVIAIKNNGQSAGDVLLKIEFFPAGTLSIVCLAGKQLRSVDAIGRQDPYVKFTAEGRSTKIVMKTKTDTDGGREPEWENERFTFQVVDQYNILVEVWDEDSVGDDDLIGAATVSLLPVFRYGYVDSWFNLWVKGKFGNKEPAGQLHLELNFEAPPGIAYPQHQADEEHEGDEEEGSGAPDKVDAVSAAARTSAAAALASKKIKSKTAAAAEKYVVPCLSRSGEFTEEEILGAFRFLDLDRNNFIGAAELRHLLICMGELITDEEIDMMVKLCDTDGDGQVSFDEFRRMVIHPDPSSADFATAPVEDPGGPIDVQLITKETTPAQKARESAIKDEKRKLMKRFVADTNPSLELLTRIALKFRQMQREALDFDDFCVLFEVEPTGEYRRLFALYTADAQSDDGADLREILLGVVNFVGGVDRAQRVKFCFEIFDGDHNGFITEDELVNILKANHMTTEAQVQKKAQTILKQADDNGDGRMSLDEFYVIAKKFPNLLFPSHESVEAGVL
ncbi:hypothetical protein PybrP1_011963 [[Pythium] brassicae (nom. inval.)]|nr:hypothetical protein PybrP1_011963 [[Pythium] brassicae (nom. inval.)]